jgi:hypothetical protein
MQAQQRFQAFEHEFMFVFDELQKLSAQVDHLCTQWDGQLQGTAAPPASWHIRQFKDGSLYVISSFYVSLCNVHFLHPISTAQECFLQLQLRFDKLVLPRQCASDWIGSDDAYFALPTVPESRQARKDAIRQCENFIQRLQTLMDAFEQRFAASKRTDNWQQMYEAIGGKQAPKIGQPAAASSPLHSSATSSPHSSPRASESSSEKPRRHRHKSKERVCDCCRRVPAPPARLRRCPCGTVFYCDEQCQLQHWQAEHFQHCTAE